jgi:hypothetical protein
MDLWAGALGGLGDVDGEIHNACLSKLDPQPNPATVRREIEPLLLTFSVVPLTGPVVLSEVPPGLREHLLFY